MQQKVRVATSATADIRWLGQGLACWQRTVKVDRQSLRRRQPPQVHLRLKARNIEDIITELEAGGFEVNALVASKGQRAAV